MSCRLNSVLPAHLRIFHLAVGGFLMTYPPTSPSIDAPDGWNTWWSRFLIFWQWLSKVLNYCRFNLQGVNLTINATGFPLSPILWLPCWQHSWCSCLVVRNLIEAYWSSNETGDHDAKPQGPLLFQFTSAWYNSFHMYQRTSLNTSSRSNSPITKKIRTWTKPKAANAMRTWLRRFQMSLGDLIKSRGLTHQKNLGLHWNA